MQICVWNTDGWEKQKTRFLQLPPGRTPSAQSDTRVQFHQDQIQFLVVHETQLAIFEATKLECLKQVSLLSSMCYLIDFNMFLLSHQYLELQWAPRDSSAPISHATFSCDSQLIYASFLDATVCVFNASNLRLRCRINPPAYLPASVR